VIKFLQTFSIFEQSKVGHTIPSDWCVKIEKDNNANCTISVLESKVFVGKESIKIEKWLPFLTLSAL
jgi:hypothetical protein